MASESRPQQRRIVVFDLGGVLIDWNPRYLFRKLAPNNPERVEYFLEHICNLDWNEQQDGGRTFAEAIAETSARHPDWADWINAYWNRWPEMLGSDFSEMVKMFAALKKSKTPCYALTNWSAETFPMGQAKFEFLSWFDGIIVSGAENLKKPDPEIYRLLCRRFGFSPQEAVYIDDMPRNVDAAYALGFEAIHHQTPEKTIARIRSLGFTTA